MKRRVLRDLYRMHTSGILEVAVLLRSVKGPIIQGASRGKESRFGVRKVTKRGVTTRVLHELGFSGSAVHGMAHLMG